VTELEELAKKIAPMSYYTRDYTKLGLLYKLLHVENPEKPSAEDIRNVQNELIWANAHARSGPVYRPSASDRMLGDLLNLSRVQRGPDRTGDSLLAKTDNRLRQLRSFSLTANVYNKSGNLLFAQS
jgi:hypothetical protein